MQLQNDPVVGPLARHPSLSLDSSTMTSHAASIVVNYTSPSGRVVRTRKLRDALVTHHNTRRQLLLESSGIAPLFFPLDEATQVCANFVNEGKLSLRSGTAHCTVLVAGAPPHELAQLVARIRGVPETGTVVAKSESHASKLSKPHVVGDGRGTTPTSPAEPSFSLLAKAAAHVQSASTTASKRANIATLLARQSTTGSTSKIVMTSAPAKPHDGLVELTPEQMKVVSAVMEGHSVFYTGGAGTGKSAVLKELRRALPSTTTVFTGTTGVAACAIGGITVHAFAGVPVASVRALQSRDMTVTSIVEAVRRRRDAVQRWKTIKTLVIDEISMLDAETFDLFEAVARGVRSDARPFGGVQLCVAGDFFQVSCNGIVSMANYFELAA